MRALSILLFLVGCAANAQQGPKAMLWRITPAAGGGVGYVLGTVHSPDARAYRNVAVALEALEGCDLFAGEVDFDGAQSTLARELSAVMLPDGKQLKDLYSRRRYRKVHAVLQERLGFMAPMMERIRPFFLLPVISQEAAEGDSALVLDQYLQEKARARGIEVVGLESVAEQLEAVNSVPLEEQADMLYQAVTEAGGANDMGRILDHYAQQDLDALVEAMGTADLSERFNQGLIGKRNRVMVQRMDSLMRAGRRGLFAVGAAHLPQPQGVLEGLRQLGYTVVPLPDTAALREEDR